MRRRLSVGAIALIAVLVVALVGGAMLLGSYNSLVDISENVEGQRANIETQLQRRNNLIPNLVNTVKGYAAHEEAVFGQLADARAKLAGGGSIADLASANAEMESALSRLLLVVENYPDLKSDRQYTALMDELAGTENRITVARKDYNDAVQVYNKKMRTFPTMLFAGIFGFEKAEYFEAAAGAETPPVVDFGA